MRNLITRVILILVIFSAPGFALPHGNLIKGTVSDAATGEVLTGASVVLNKADAITRTDQLGKFHFDNVADGNYTVTVTFMGYLPYKLDVALSQDETHSISIRLSPWSLRLEEVTITGSQSPERTMTTISKIDVELRPLKYPCDISLPNGCSLIWMGTMHVADHWPTPRVKISFLSHPGLQPLAD